MRTRSRSRFAALGALAAAAVMAGCIPPAEPTPTTSVPGEAGTVSELIGATPGQEYVSLSVDARFAASQLYDPEADTRSTLLADRVAGTVERLAEQGYVPEVSDDGNVVVYRHTDTSKPGNPTTHYWDVPTGEVTSIPLLGDAEFGSTPPASVSSDGGIVAYIVGQNCFTYGCVSDDIYSNLYVYDRSVRGAQQITPFGHDPSQAFRGTGVVDAAAVSGDGSTVVFVAAPPSTDGSPAARTLLSLDVATGAMTPLASPTGAVRSLSVSDDGTRVAYQVNTLDTSSGTLNAEFRVEVLDTDEELDLSDTPLAIEEDQGYPQLSADGEMLFYAVGHQVVYLEPTLQSDELVAVSLDGSFSARRPFDDVLTVEAVERDGVHGVAFHSFGNASVIRLWEPR